MDQPAPARADDGKMSQNEAPDDQNASAEDEAPGSQEDALELAQQVGQGLAKLSEMLNASPEADDEEKAQMSQIMNLFVDLVEKKLGGGAQGDAESDDKGVMGADQAQPVGMMQGNAGVPMGPQSRQ